MEIAVTFKTVDNKEAFLGLGFVKYLKASLSCLASFYANFKLAKSKFQITNNRIREYILFINTENIEEHNIAIFFSSKLDSSRKHLCRSWLTILKYSRFQLIDMLRKRLEHVNLEY